MSRISALSGDGITVLLLYRNTPSTVLSPSLNWKNTRMPEARSNREVMPWKPSSIFFLRFCRFSSRRMCSRTSTHVTARMSPRFVAAATASVSSRSADVSGSHVMEASGRRRRGSKQAMESDSSKSLSKGSFFASPVGFLEFASGAFSFSPGIWIIEKRYGSVVFSLSDSSLSFLISPKVDC